MRFLMTTLLLITISQLQAQVFGNGKRATQTRTYDHIEEIFVNANGKVNIYCNASVTKAEISYDENIVSLLRTQVKKGKMIIDQEKWIEGTQEFEINIYLPSLEVLTNDSWSEIDIYDLNQESIKVNASISKVRLYGSVNHIDIVSEDGHVHAEKLQSKTAKVNIKEAGKVFVNASERLDCKSSKEGKVVYQGEPEVFGRAYTFSSFQNEEPIDTRYIDVKFKNNSFRKISAYVRGPKPDGNYFSYGLNFAPMLTKAERWTVGTKLYKVGLFGKKTLIHEVKAEDENRTIKLKK